MNPEKLLKPVPVRLRIQAKHALENLSRQFAITPAELIRIAVNQKLREWKKAHPRTDLALPVLQSTLESGS